MTPQPDMNKVAAAVAALEARQNMTMSRITALVKVIPKDHRIYPPVASPPAQDSAIRKSLRAHGIKCSGFNCSHFYNKD